MDAQGWRRMCTSFHDASQHPCEAIAAVARHLCTTLVWYADDASAGGKMDGLRAWWDKITEFGPEYDYFPNPAKTWLVVKEEYLEAAH